MNGIREGVCSLSPERKRPPSALVKYLAPFSEIPLRIFIRLSEPHFFVAILHVITLDSVSTLHGIQQFSEQTIKD